MDHAVSLGLKLALDEVAIQKYTIPTWGQFFFFLPKRRKRERGEGGGEREEGRKNSARTRRLGEQPLSSCSELTEQERRSTEERERRERNLERENRERES
jgi:hypothetical protein